jgi:hypothetical protein
MKQLVNAAIATIMLFIAVSYTGAQQQAAKPVGTALLTGKVFAITKGGDVKPALLAHVYLYFSGAAYSAIFNEFLTAIIKSHDVLEAKLKSQLDDPELANDAPYKAMLADHLKTSCRELLRDVDKQISDDRERDPKLFVPDYTAETDETGSFEIARIKPGDYQIVVRGQAGSNDVLWVGKVTIIAGATKTLKLSSVARACQVE